MEATGIEPVSVRGPMMVIRYVETLAPPHYNQLKHIVTLTRSRVALMVYGPTRASPVPPISIITGLHRVKSLVMIVEDLTLSRPALMAPTVIASAFVRAILLHCKRVRTFG